jgi:hypothetical protein
MADTREQPPVIPAVVFDNPQYKDPIRFALAEEIENSLKRDFRAHLVETAQELLLELTR